MSDSKEVTKIGTRKPPAAGMGRPKGTPNKTTQALKDAILEAAKAVGSDGEGKKGLQGYLENVARTDIKAFSGLLGRVLPLQVTGEGGGPVVARIELVPMNGDRAD